MKQIYIYEKQVLVSTKLNYYTTSYGPNSSGILSSLKFS